MSGLTASYITKADQNASVQAEDGIIPAKSRAFQKETGVKQGENPMYSTKRRSQEEERPGDGSCGSCDEALTARRIKIGRPGISEEEMCRSMERDLLRYEKAGIPIYLSGREETARTAARATMLRENGSYSCSYQTDSKGCLGLYFERLQEQSAAK